MPTPETQCDQRCARKLHVARFNSSLSHFTKILNAAFNPGPRLCSATDSDTSCHPWRPLGTASRATSVSL